VYVWIWWYRRKVERYEAREGERGVEWDREYGVCVCVCVCVWDREYGVCVYVCVYVCVCVWWKGKSMYEWRNRLCVFEIVMVCNQVWNMKWPKLADL